ncbi:hypothetical protein ACZ90_69055, partial [Streptomyces albus subsp. albus]
MIGRSRIRMGAGLRRRVALATSTLLVAGAIQVVSQPGAQAEGRGWPDKPTAEEPVQGAWQGKVKPRTVQKGPKVPQRAPQARWTSGGTAKVRIPAASGSSRPTLSVAGDLPIALTAAKPDKQRASAAGATPRTVEARVLDHAKAQRAGVDGLLFTLTPQEQPRRASAAPADLGVGVRVDYSAFSEAYGGGYASRLRLFELPACVLTTPTRAACHRATPVMAVNDTEKRTLTAQSVSLRAGGPSVLAATAGEAGAKGDFKATSLSPSATWNTNLNTGDFTWSYPMALPEVPGGLKPSVGLDYSSASVDGRTGGTNNQSSWVGDGFEMWPGYIERRYKPCAEDGVKNPDGNKPGDLCWGYDNAILSLNGGTGELVPAGDGEWKLKNDNGTRIKRLTSSARDNGDNDNEYWEVTDPSGTRYYFGYHKLDGWTSGKETTDSTWTVPVYGDDAGEKCHADAFKDSWCQQAWRWNLDYVVDVHGNAAAYYYTKETNSYGRNLKAEDDTPYTRGGYLDRIEYGLKSDRLYTDKALGRVTFINTERCIPASGVSCDAADIDKNRQYWYDTPWDLNCKAGTKCDQGRLAPTFWTRKRLTEVTAEVLKDGSYTKADSWKLTHRWGTADVDYQLLLDSVQHVGHTATTPVTVPQTTFAYTQLQNRLDKIGDGKAPFIKDRLSTVSDESGGELDVNYSAPVCDRNDLPTPQTNTTRCFPQFIGGDASDAPDKEWFNKYVVESVTATDRMGGAPDQVTRYSYLDGAAWHFDDDDGLTKEKYKTWSQWRGYGHVRMQTGGQGADGMKSQEDHYFLRGMHGDKADSSDRTKTVEISLGEGEGDPITDHESAAGFEYKIEKFSGPGGRTLEKSVSRPWHHETARRTRSWGTVTANFAGVGYQKKFESLDGGAGTKWRTSSISAEHDTVAGRVIEVDDHGDTSNAADNSCVRTTYATSTSANLLDLPARVESVAKACDAAVDRSEDVISDVRTAYDGGAFGATPTKGDPTAIATLKKHDGKTATYLESGAGYDSYGRELTNTDLVADVVFDSDGKQQSRSQRSDGRTTTTVYTPATGVPTQVAVTDPPVTPGDASTAYTTKTLLDPVRQQPVTEFDINGKRTDYSYDALGRTTGVWLPNRSKAGGDTPNHQFAYITTEGKPVAVATSTLGPNTRQLTSYTVYDGLLRERQTQAPGPEGGTVLSDTFYDERGLVTKTFAPYFAEVKPSAQLFQPDNALNVETQTRHAYDGLGRETESRQIGGNGDGGTVLSTTRTIYGGDRVTVIPPEGGTATTAVTDVQGRTVELREHHTRDADAAVDSTHYSYNPRGQLEQLTDPAGNTWTHGYDQLGRETTSTDPDQGTTHSTYDDRSQLTSTTNARKTDNKRFYFYDGIGRQTEVRKDSATGPLLTQQTYDTVSGAKGQPATSTRFVNGNAYTTKTTEYDKLYRSKMTQVIIPASEGALAGTYPTATSYNTNGTLAAISFPKAGALPGGTVTYEYDDILRLKSTSGPAGEKSTVTYSRTGKPLLYELGSGDVKKIEQRNSYEWGTQRLAGSQLIGAEGSGLGRNLSYGYDQAGNVTSISEVSATGTDTQCFRYDYLRRTTEAWTQGTKTCATSPAASEMGGPAPYWQSFTYDKTGNRLTETWHDPSGDAAKNAVRTYHYPPSGPGVSHAHRLGQVDTAEPTGTSKSTYEYDETGNTVKRTLSGDTQDLLWDPEGHLAKVTKPGKDGSPEVTEYVYDAGGNRLIGRTAKETTLYLGHTEITLPKGATTAKATRYTDLGGGQQAVLTDDGKVSFTVGDHHGTGELAVDAASLKATQRRTTPFGAIRDGGDKPWPGSKGFVGGTTDTTTGLTHLGAREYDPTIGRFISVDPVMDTSNPQQLHGYAYGNNSPATFSDPSGLFFGGLGGLFGGFLGGWDPIGDIGDALDTGWKSTKSFGKGFAHKTVDLSYDLAEGGYRLIGQNDKANAIKADREGRNLISVHKTIKDAIGKPENNRAYGVGAFVAELLFPFLPGATGAAGVTGKATAKTGKISKILKAIFSKATKKAASSEAANVPAKAAPKAAAVEAKAGAPAAAGGPCHSFLPGTGVLLADGSTKPIEDVKTGDKVTVTDPESGDTTPR